MLENNSNSTPVKKVILTDDHPVVRHAIKTIIESRGEFSVVAEAESLESCLEVIDTVDADVLILDLGLKGKTGIEILHKIQEKNIQIKVLVLSMYDDEYKVKQAISCGAGAYILKDSPPEQIFEALDSILKNELYLPVQFEHLKEELSANSGRKDCTKYDPLYKLSNREREVFYMLVEGKPNRVIAKQLFLSPRTIETHRARLIKKLGLNSTADLVRYAIRNNLLSL